MNRSVATSIVGSNTLNRKNFSNANILKVKTTEAHFDKSQSWLARGNFEVKSKIDTDQTESTSVYGREVLLTDFPAHNIYFEKTRGVSQLIAADMVSRAR